MAEFFIRIYRFFHKQKWAFYLFLTSLTLIMLFLASRIRLEEDISGMRSGDEGLNKYEYVIKNFKFAEKLIIHIYQQDSLSQAEPDSLILFANSFSDQLRSRFDSTYIRSLLTRVDDSVYYAITSTIDAHLPLFLSLEDYRLMDSLLLPENLVSALRSNYRVLLSPASMVIKKQLIADPLGFRNLAMNKLKSLQVDEQYTMMDGYIFSRNQKHLFLFLTPQNSPSETEKNTRLVEGIDKITHTLVSGNPPIRLEYFGAIAVASGNAKQLKKDILLSLSIAIFLIFLLIGWYFRSWLVPLLGFLPAIFGGGFALAVLYLLKGNISAIALGIGSVILGLIIDYALYLINQYRQKQSVELLLKEMSQTIVVCCLTSAGAFLCLIFLDSAVLHDLGWFAALSVTGAALFSLLVLPHFLHGKLIKSANGSGRNLIDRIAEIKFEKKGFFLALIFILIMLSFYFSRKVGFEKDLSSLNFLSPALRDAEKNLDLSGESRLKNVYIVSTGPTFQEALKNNEFVQVKLKALQQHKIIQMYSGIRFLLMSDSLQQNGIRHWKDFWTPEKKVLFRKNLTEAALKAGFKRNTYDGFVRLPEQEFTVLNKQDSRVFQSLLFSDWINEKPEMTMISCLVKVTAEQKEKLYKTSIADKNTIVFDRQNLTTRFVSGVKADFSLLVKLSMIFVTLLLLISFGRIELGLLTALPMFIAWLITLGFMGFLGLTFNIFNIILSSFIFGLGVDYSILMMRGLMEEYKYGGKEIHSYKVSVILSSVTTLIGVSALFFAKHPALQSIALISLIGIIAVVLITFTIQPLFFRWLILNRIKRNGFPGTFRIFIKTFLTWGNIVMIAMLMSVIGSLIYLLAPIPRKKKEYLFHTIFSKLCKFYIFITFPTNGKLFNPHREDFLKPAVIISNHQSLIETPAFLRLTPKILILTNDWVFKSPVFGPIARLGGFINVDHGLEANLEKLKLKIAEGYSILIFPEGHRSRDQHIQRFHRGAFYLAEKLQVDLLPVLVFGSGDFLAKGNFLGKPNGFRMKILKRIPYDDSGYGESYSLRSKQIRKLYIQAYSQLKSEEGTAFYYRKMLLLNYIFKGPLLEWYLRVKLRLENNYELYSSLLPREGEILDLGCGYGFISYMLMFCSGNRLITGVDYDAEKISVAEHCYSKNNRIGFVCADVSKYPITPKNGFLLSDVLHYLPPEKQENLLRNCFSNLKPGGSVLIREANKDLQDRHKKSKYTEFLSTGIGFNKTHGPEKTLYYTSAEPIRAIAMEFGLTFDIIDNKKITSNNIFLIRSKGKTFA